MHELNQQIEQLCKSKAEEFALMGYEHVTGKEVWDCISEKYNGELPPIHQLVNDILSLKVTTFMNWMTLNAYKGLNIN
ncbi:post-transcriptional regulator [Tepidibacillus infernus]|uniref:post-transcriptional regulator n=1 Tax=Tepidibacillus TaxID=1494427 RepID=UPI0008536285|nr:post-transcriptional regulator [Tepidibacillus sp. HK-1]GBF10048.1 post-transcriptional regulator ComN [Tepidibacillus sp. HK-1]